MQCAPKNLKDLKEIGVLGLGECLLSEEGWSTPRRRDPPPALIHVDAEPEPRRPFRVEDLLGVADIDLRAGRVLFDGDGVGEEAGGADAGGAGGVGGVRAVGGVERDVSVFDEGIRPLRRGIPHPPPDGTGRDVVRPRALMEPRAVAVLLAEFTRFHVVLHLEEVASPEDCGVGRHRHGPERYGEKVVDADWDADWE